MTLTAESPPGLLGAAGQLGYSGGEGEAKQQPANHQQRDGVMTVMPYSVV